MKKRFGLVWMLVAVMILLSGCGMELPWEETAGSKTAEETEADEDVTPEKTEGESAATGSATEQTGETDEDETEMLVSDSPVKEWMLSYLWKDMLQQLDRSAKAAEKLDQWDRSYDVEALLEDFDPERTKYGTRYVYPRTKIASWTVYWSDNITDVSESYEEAENLLQYVYENFECYLDDNEWLTKTREESILRIIGQVSNETYDQGYRFTDNVGKYSYHGMWGAVLEIMGGMYQENTGSFLGKFAGDAYLMEFDFETLIGTFWLCMEGQEPVQVQVTYANKDCMRYTFQICEDAVWNASEPDSAWLGLEFELVTTRSKK